MKIISPFGPKIGKIKLPKKIIRIINQEVDRIINNEILSNKLNYSKKLVGQVKQEFQLTKNFINKNLTKVIEKEVKLFIKKTLKKTVKKIKIKNLWIVRQFENEYNPVHYHSGHLSGVGYLKLPNDFGKLFQSSKPKNLNGNIALIHGGKMFNSESVFEIKPKVGDFYLFPNYLMHTVYPFYGKDERRSISFNATIDENIYNIN